MQQNPPIGFAIAVAAAASLVPGIAFLDGLLTGGGDGFRGAGNTVLFLLAALIITLGGVIAGFRRNEKHRWLSLVALVLWLVPLWLMTM